MARMSWRSGGAGLWVALIVLCAWAVRAQAGPAPRAVIPLDGRWQFRTDPENKGVAERWFDAEAAFKGRITVPGAWDSQGVGTPTQKVHHNFVGKGWCRRQIEIPAAWRGRRIFLTVGGVHRYARTWVNAQPLPEHIGYLSDFEYDITPHVQPGTTATLTVCVDSKQRWDVDCLTGCVDIIDAMFVSWGGIWGHVALEARDETWLTDLFVQPRVNPSRLRVSAVLAGKAIGDAGLRLEVLDADGKAVATGVMSFTGPLKAGRTVEIAVKIPRAKLWSPNTPHLYTARLSLVKGARTLDSIQTRFGLREITIEGPHVLLNGRKIFLHGYGDDSVYPETLAPPTDKAAYVKRLKLAREYGFNYVRHHSHFLPVEYYDAADEVGMLVSPELPIAYLNYYRRAKAPALELYKTEWSSVIRRLRNHPSILDWCMGNEMWDAVPISPALYRIAKRLDPTRPVIDSNGLRGTGWLHGRADRATLDFYLVLFQIHHLPLDRPNKHTFPAPGKPAKPVISHETGNYGTFPRLDLIEKFTHNVKPFWLTPVRATLEKLGLLGEADLWARNSERLYLLSHKLNMEDIRKRPYMSGYQWWLLQDYWTGSNGLVDAYFRPKKGIRPAEVRQFNADVVLLQDGLPMTCRGNQRSDVKLLVSNYGPRAIRDGRFGYSLTGRTTQHRAIGSILGAQSTPGVRVDQGQVKRLLTFKMPELNWPVPGRVFLHASLSVSQAGVAETKPRMTEEARNGWATWVYPAKIAPPELKVPLFADPVLAGALGRWGAKPVPAGDLPERAVYVMRQPSPRVVDAVAKGASLVLLSPAGLLPTAPTRFKTSWWLGSAKDCNVGTVVYDNPVTREMAPDGWCDAGWYRLLEGAQTYILDGLAAPPQVMVRALDVHRFCRSKALMFQARVGRGCLIVSGLKLFLHDRDRPPEAEWLLKRLIEHAGSPPRPKAELPVELLRDCAVNLAPPPGPYVLGYRRMIAVAEKGTWHSYREDNTTNYCCRQLAVGTRMEWETSPAPPEHKGKPVTFVFAGGLGWRSQPKTKGFAFDVAGKEAFTFDLTRTRGAWKSPDGKVRMVFLPLRQLPLDTVGLFYVTVAADMLTPGKPLRLGVVSKGKGSRRWFGLNPYTDVLTRP